MNDGRVVPVRGRCWRCIVCTIPCVCYCLMQRLWQLRKLQSKYAAVGDIDGRDRVIHMQAALEWVLGTKFRDDGSESKTWSGLPPAPPA